MSLPPEQLPRKVALHSHKQEMAPGIYAWCSCGLSSTQPFCDGSHASTEFTPEIVHIATACKVSWCLCKHSKLGAICDGEHKKFPGYVKPVK